MTLPTYAAYTAIAGMVAMFLSMWVSDSRFHPLVKFVLIVALIFSALVVFPVEVLVPRLSVDSVIEWVEKTNQ